MMQQVWIQMNSRPLGLVKVVRLVEDLASIHLEKPSGPNSQEELMRAKEVNKATET